MSKATGNFITWIIMGVSVFPGFAAFIPTIARVQGIEAFIPWMLVYFLLWVPWVLFGFKLGAKAFKKI